MNHNSCRSPNFQNQPVDNDGRARAFSGKGLEEGGTDPWSVRRAYIVPSQNSVRLFFDYCLAPDTLVETISGKRPIGTLRAGDKVFTLRGERIAWGEISRTANVGKLPAYRVTFDNGESVVASADHRWPVRVRGVGRGGPIRVEERTTAELKVGERMVPMKRVQASGYTHLYSSGATIYTKEHLLVAEAAYGPRPEGYVVHHKDGNKQNNHPRNLEYVLRSEHCSMHGMENYSRQDHSKRLRKLREGLKRRRSYVGMANPNFGKLGGVRFSCACCGKMVYRPQSRAGKFCSSKCYWSARRDGNNHKIVAIEFVGEQPMVAITVEPDHNFVLGCGVVTCNSQIELRVLAFYSRDSVLVDAYQKGEDIHTRTSMEVFGTADKAMRRRAKVINFGLSYVMGPGGLARQIKVSREEAEQYMRRFFERYSGVSAFRQQFWAYVTGQRGFFQNLFGRPRRVVGILSKNPEISIPAQRQAIASLIQGTAAELTKESLVRISQFIRAEKLPAKLVATVHDEIQIDCPAEVLSQVARGVKERMEAFPEFAPIPILVDGSYSTESWASKQALPK